MKRTFIAVKTRPEKKLLEAVNNIRFELRNDSVKWVDTEMMHITLAFLGDTEENMVGKVSSSLNEQCQGTGSVSFNLSGTGVFPDLRRPKVIWAGTEKAESLVKLHSIVTDCLISLGITPEEREFIPHLTLGRIKFISDTARLSEMIKRYEKTEFQKVRINELVYYESILQPSGPVYKPISVISL